MSQPVSPTKRDESESFYKTQMEISNSQNAYLQDKVRELEHENALLKKTVFELSMLPSLSPASRDLPVDILQILRTMPGLENSATAVGKGSAFRRVAPNERAASSARDLIEGAPLDDPHPSSGPFVCKATLEGHTAAVYSVQFSPNGHLLASTSFDRGVCVWSMDKHLEKNSHEPHLTLADAHRSQVVAVEWTSDSRHIVTAGFDQTAAEWDIPSESSEALARFYCRGLLNTVTVSPANDSLFFVPTSQRVVHLFDRRAPPAHRQTEPTIIIENDEVINTVNAQLDGLRITTGDRGGALKTWDLRMASAPETASGRHSAALVHVAHNDPSRPACITHVHNSPPTPGANHGRYMAVNSYDDFLRVYDRGSFIFQHKDAELKLIHELRGPKNNNAPIKSSFFMGGDYRPARRRRARGKSRRSFRKDEPAEGADARTEAVPDSNAAEAERPATEEEEEEEVESSSDSSSEEDELEEDREGEDRARARWGAASRIQRTLTLATGSTDGYVYVFDVGGRTGTASLMQRLEEHQDRVYSVDFHPSEPILASCSADSQIKIWAPHTTRYH